LPVEKYFSAYAAHNISCWKVKRVKDIGFSRDRKDPPDVQNCGLNRNNTHVTGEFIKANI
jgi:hypothetical protein